MTDERCTCTVEVSPDEIDAGADITLTVRVECPRKDALRGAIVSIRNEGGTELARTALESSEDDAYESDDIVVTAPRTAGEHVWRAVVAAVGKDGALQERASTEVRFTVKPHTAHLTVWDVPSTIVAGERFRFTVGVKCSAGCNLGGRGLRIVDRDGALVGRGSLGGDIWPGTDALYFAEVEAEAPAAAGPRQWEVRTADWDMELPHDAGAFAVAVKVVDPPDCEVTVEVFDREKQTPIEGAHVVMHPYRATTGANGVATLKVTKGQYDILVSAPAYIPASTAVDVTADMTTRAELDVEPPFDPDGV